MEKKSFPEIVETERLVLRRYRNEDAAGILELVERNRPQLIREFAQISGLQNVEETKSFIAEKGEQWNDGRTLCYGIWRKQARQQIGQIQVKNVAWEIPSAELGYFIGWLSQRQGYASESVRRYLQRIEVGNVHQCGNSGTDGSASAPCHAAFESGLA